MPSLLALVPALLAVATLAQDHTSTANGYIDGYFPGIDTVIYTTPYTYAQVMSIIGSFRNITWSGSPYSRSLRSFTKRVSGTRRSFQFEPRSFGQKTQAATTDSSHDDCQPTRY